MSDPKTVSTKHAPAAIGPYSQAVIGGGMVHCSGQIALDPESGELVGDDAPTQAERALTNLMAVLREAGSGPDRVLKCNVYLADMGDFAAVNEVYARHFPGSNAPARATVAVKTLPKNALVEIDCVALAGS